MLHATNSNGSRGRDRQIAPEALLGVGRLIFGNLRNTSTQNIKRSFCRVVGLVKTSLTLCFEVVAANIRLVRQWARRSEFTADPLCVPMPQSHGFEELDAHGQISLTEPSFFDDPPEELAACGR